MAFNNGPAVSNSAFWRSMLCTFNPNAHNTAHWYPLPVPISSTLAPGAAPSNSLCLATVWGWLMVWPAAMGNALLLYANWENALSKK